MRPGCKAKPEFQSPTATNVGLWGWVNGTRPGFDLNAGFFRPGALLFALLVSFNLSSSCRLLLLCAKHGFINFVPVHAARQLIARPSD